MYNYAIQKDIVQLMSIEKNESIGDFNAQIRKEPIYRSTIGPDNLYDYSIRTGNGILTV